MPHQEIFEKLRDLGFRLTTSRRQLIVYILSKKGHWNIQEIATEAKKISPGTGIATVYRTVNLLRELNLLSVTRFGSDSARFEVAKKTHHDHLTCQICKEVFEFKNNEIERLQHQVAKRLGFELVDHRMELYGDCQRNSCPGKV